jgi:predicted PurR-regulated permease PerM
VISPPYATGRRDPGSRPEQWFGQFWKLLVRLALIVFIAYFLWRVRSILTDVLVSAILAFALVGPVNWLCRFRVKRLGLRTQRLLATLLVFIGFGFLLFQSASLMLSPFRTEAVSLKQNMPQYEVKIKALAASARTWYATLPPDLRTFLQKQDAGSVAPSPAAWLHRVLDVTVAGLAKIVDVILIPVLAFYFVLDGHALRNEFLALLPRRRLREAFHLLRESSSIMQSYIIAQFWLCLIAGVVVYAGLSAVGMKYALILGLLAGFTRAIPIIGPVIGGIPIVLLSLIVPGGGLILAVKILIFFSLMHLVESKLLMPKFIGHRINLHAALVIIVLLIGGEFFGLLGMFLAAPLAAIGRVLIGHYVIRPRRLADRMHASAASKPSLMIQA